MHEVPMHTGGAGRQMDTAIFCTLPEVPEKSCGSAQRTSYGCSASIQTDDPQYPDNPLHRTTVCIRWVGWMSTFGALPFSRTFTPCEGRVRGLPSFRSASSELVRTPPYCS